MLPVPRLAAAPGPSAASRTSTTDDRLWGGTVEDIRQTVTHGIRFEADADTRYSQMPAFGDILSAEEIAGSCSMSGA